MKYYDDIVVYPTICGSMNIQKADMKAFKVYNSGFDTLDEAVKFAQKETKRTKEDTPVYALTKVAKFPLDDIKVEDFTLPKK